MAAGGQSAAALGRGRTFSLRVIAAPLILLALACLALVYVGYVFWPHRLDPALASDAPELPIVISGMTFNIAPTAIRRAVQRRPGAQERVDLVYLWPSLAPPQPPPKIGAAAWADRVFLTIETRAGALPPTERLNAVYARYLDAEATGAPAGLRLVVFRSETPYDGEDLVFDPAAPERFLARCARAGAASAPAVCLYERMIGAAKVTLRFPRDWLDEWRAIAAGLDRLVERWRPAPE
jgi:hypothetical protein